MTTTPRPNREALSKAIDIYRDAMRPFILRSLSRIPGTTAELAINQSLPDQQAENLRATLASGTDLESALDVNNFPNLVSNRYNWRDAFSTAFGGDKTVQNELWLITDARNQVSHPGIQDLEDEYTRSHLYHISDVLGKINAPDLKHAVEEIRDQLTRPEDNATSTEPTQSTMEPTEPPAVHPSARQQSPRCGQPQTVARGDPPQPGHRPGQLPAGRVHGGPAAGQRRQG